MTVSTAPEQALPKLPLVGIFGGLFCGYAGLTAVIPILPADARGYGASNLLVGAVVTGTALTALLTRPIAGNLADRHGYRLVMQVGAIILTLGAIGYFHPFNLFGLIVDRLILGVGEAALFTGGAAWTMSLAPHNRRGQLIGLYGMSMWGGISVGTFVGATVLSSSFHQIFTFSLIVPIVGLVLISSVPSPARNPTPPARSSLMLGPAALPGIGLALGAAGYAGVAAFVASHLSARGIGHGAVVLSCFSAVYGLTRLVIGHLPDQLGPRRCATYSGIGEAIGLVIIMFAHNLTVALIGSIIMGAGFSLLHPSFALMVMNRTDRSQQGAALGAYTSFWDLGLAVWGPITGAIAAASYPAVFLTAAVCAVAASGLALTIPEPQRGRELALATPGGELSSEASPGAAASPGVKVEAPPGAEVGS